MDTTKAEPIVENDENDGNDHSGSSEISVSSRRKKNEEEENNCSGRNSFDHVVEENSNDENDNDKPQCENEDKQLLTILSRNSEPDEPHALINPTEIDSKSSVDNQINDVSLERSDNSSLVDDNADSNGDCECDDGQRDSSTFQSWYEKMDSLHQMFHDGVSTANDEESKNDFSSILHVCNVRPLDSVQDDKHNSLSCDDRQNTVFACTISDGKITLTCLIVQRSLSTNDSINASGGDKNSSQPSLVSSTIDTQFMVSINGFVLLPKLPSDFGPKELTEMPFVCIITRYEILCEQKATSTVLQPEHHDKCHLDDIEQLASGFVRTYDKVLQMDPADMLKPSLLGFVDDEGKNISQFLQQHKLQMMIHQEEDPERREGISSSSSSSTAARSNALSFLSAGEQSMSTMVQKYCKSVNEFEVSEREKVYQAAYFGSMTLFESRNVENTNLIEDSNRNHADLDAETTQTIPANSQRSEAIATVLDEILDYDDDPPGPTILSVCRPGDSMFRLLRPRCVLDKFSTFCNHFQKVMIPNLHGQPYSIWSIMSFTVYSTFVLCHMNDIEKPFVAYAVLQWAIRRAGFPFCINLDTKEKEMFLHSLKASSCGFRMILCGEATDSDFWKTWNYLHISDSLIDVLIRRMSHTIDAFGSFLAEKAHSGREDAEARIVRKARERTVAAEKCIICFDSTPNISTLCCGQPVHFHCLNEWLSRSTTSSCPQCRSDIPSASNQGTQLSSTIRFVSEDEDSDVEELLHYITNNDSDVDSDSSRSSSSSSSSSSDSSSSSSSSSTSSAFVYNELHHYSVNYITSDEDETTEADENSRSTDTDDQTGTDAEHYIVPEASTDVRLPESTLQYFDFQSDFDPREVEPIGDVGPDDEFSGLQSLGLDPDTIIGTPSSGSVIADTFVPSSPHSHIDDEDIYFNESDYQSSSTSYASASQSPPRMSFLDQALLDDVNYRNTTTHDSDNNERPLRSTRRAFAPFVAESYSTDDDDDEAIYGSHDSDTDDIPLFALPPARQTERILSIIASHRAARDANTGQRWIPPPHPSESDIYDSETHDEADEEEPGASGPPSPPYHPSPLVTLHRRLEMLPINITSTGEDSSSHEDGAANGFTDESEDHSLAI